MCELKTIACLLVLAALAAVGIYLAVDLTGSDSPQDLIPEDFDPRDYIPTLEEFFHEDPYNATTPEEANRWDHTNGRSGLQLQIVNALEDSWTPYFERAVSEWDNGDPDVLTLSTSRGSYPDVECAPIEGVMKVCNGDYGQTGWKGINEVLLQFNKIVSSSAKMNEYYLYGAGDAHKQYTMCHEVS